MATFAVPVAVQKRVLGLAKLAAVTGVDIAEGHPGLLFVDGKFIRALEAGAHMFWAVNRKAVVKTIDLRRQSLDVVGQEILTRDRVTLRVNLAAEYQVVDAVKAATTVKDFEDALYRALQFAFRKSLGTKNLDEILADKVTAEIEAVERVRTAHGGGGRSAAAVGEIAVKDVILPGEMRTSSTRLSRPRRRPRPTSSVGVRRRTRRVRCSTRRARWPRT